MSVLNITGEGANPAKSFVLREVSEFYKMKKKNENEVQKQSEVEKREKRIELNRKWRNNRSMDKHDEIIVWTEESDSKAKKNCQII